MLSPRFAVETTWRFSVISVRSSSSAAAPSPAPPSFARSAGRGRLRVLALHGYMQSGGVFLNQRVKDLVTKPLTRVLLDVVAPDGPTVIKRNGAKCFRAWFSYDPQLNVGGPLGWHDPEWWSNENVEFIGIEDTLAAIEAAWIEHGPFDGLLGFSQAG